jgi:hypothetical protein
MNDGRAHTRAGSRVFERCSWVKKYDALPEDSGLGLLLRVTRALQRGRAST